ncbi:hypothetical protein [Pelosinus sp. sgz500959]|uniref:hypothetical protein n=1 Tax=Pelosinus sp. sgz500959 TaxID=3242472 RepID=UPI0036710592
MLKRTQTKKPMSLDLEHIRMLHAEAIEQLDLMYTTLEAAEQANDTMRDRLDDMSINHWDAYMDVTHLICMHDEAMSSAMKKYSTQMREAQNDSGERQLGLHRVCLLFLLLALLRHHRRLEHIFSLRGTPMNDYFQESLTMEREHISHLIAMTQTLL